MPTSTGRLVIGDKVYYAWPNPLRRLLDMDLVEIDPTRTHANPPTFRLKLSQLRNRIMTEQEIATIVEATTARIATR